MPPAFPRHALVAVLFVKQNLGLAVSICLYEHAFQRIAMPIMNYGVRQGL